jgi:hypothetical protein
VDPRYRLQELGDRAVAGERVALLRLFMVSVTTGPTCS